MAYSPPSCDNIQFSVSGEYTPPPCDSITFGQVSIPVQSDSAVVETTATESSIFSIPGLHTDSATVSVAAGTSHTGLCNKYAFTLGPEYLPPVCDSIRFQFGEVAIGISPHSAVVETFAEDSLLDTLHTIVADSAVIDIAASTSTIGVLDAILSSDAFIVVSAQTHLIYHIVEILSADGIITTTTDNAGLSPTPPQALPTGTRATGKAYPWGTGIPVDTHKCFPWDAPRHVTKQVCFPSVERPGHDKHVSIPWTTPYELLLKWCSSYSNAAHEDITTCSSWKTLTAYDLKDCIPHGDSEETDIKRCVPYRSPERKEVRKCIPHKEFPPADHRLCSPWRAPEAKDSKKCTVWGPFSYYLLCYIEKYWPPKPCHELKFAFPSKYPIVTDVCKDITFRLNAYSSDPDPRCPYQHWHSGARDNYPGMVPVKPSEFPKPKQVYYMLNTVSVTELVTGMPIEVLGISCVTDKNSWLWQFSITIANRGCLRVIEPTKASMKSLLIEINGYKWVCVVEGWSESRAFGRDTWTITGRSPSLMFGAPFSKPRSGTETADKQGQQLFDDIVTGKVVPDIFPPNFSTWKTDWTLYNKVTTGFSPSSMWYVPGGTLTFQNATEIDVLKQISGAIGAYIYTVADCRDDNCVLKVVPSYLENPWNWTDTNSHIDWRYLIDSQIVEVSRAYKSTTQYQAVLVVGESTGGSNDGTGPGTDDAVMARVCHNNCSPTDGSTVYAPMVTDRLITSTKAGLERGRTVICESGEWCNHSLRIPVLCPPTDKSMGLYLPGDMVAVQERGSRWNGQVTGITVSVAGTGGMFTVTQTVEIEEYRGGPPCE